MKNLFIMLLGVFLISCEDERESFPIHYPSSYVSVTLESKTKVRVFTKQGEIIDQQAIDGFVQRHGDGFLYTNNYRQEAPVGMSDSLMILSASHAQLKRSYHSKWRDYTLNPNGQELDLIAQDTVLTIGNSQDEFRDRYFHILAKAFVRNWYTFYETPKFPFPGFAVRYVERIVVQTTPTQLLFPKMSYVLKQHKQGVNPPDFYYNEPVSYSLYKISGINNSLKEIPEYSQLFAGDTLGVQVFQHIWERN